MAYGYQGPSMAPGASVASVIDRIRQQRRQARELAAEERKTKQRVGMGALKFDSSLRAWQMARVAKPDLSYGDFIMNPTAAGVYQKKAANMIMNNEAEMPKMMSLKRYTDLFKGKGKGDVDLKKELTTTKPTAAEVKTEGIDTTPLYEGAFRTDPTDVPSTFGSGDELVYPIGTEQRFLGQGGTSLTRGVNKVIAQERSDMLAKGGGVVPSADPEDMDLTQVAEGPGPGQDLDEETLQMLMGADMDLTDAEGNTIGTLDPKKEPGISGLAKRTIKGGESGYEFRTDEKEIVSELDEKNIPGKGKVWGQSLEPDPPSEDLMAAINKALEGPDIVTDEQGNVITEMPSGAINPELKGEIKSADEYRDKIKGYVDEQKEGIVGDDTIDPKKFEEMKEKVLSEPLTMTDAEGNVTGTLDPKKAKGLKGFLQRAVPGGKSGYRPHTEAELADALIKKEKPIRPEVEIEPDLPDDIEDITAKPGDVKTEGASIGDAAGKAGDIVGGASALHTLYNADPSDIEIGDVKAGFDVAKLGAKGAAEMGSKGGAALGQTLGKAAPWVSVAMSVNTLADKKSTDTQKAGALMSAAGAVAMTNFWNPAGWVAGALMVGGTLASLFGGKAQKQKRSVRAATGYRGGSGYSYV